MQLKIMPSMIRLCLITASVMAVSACTTTTPKEQSLIERIDRLETELAAKNASTSNVRSFEGGIEISSDPLFDTYQMLQRVDNSSADNVNVLDYASGNYGPSVTVYPVDGKTKNIEAVLKPRGEQYPRHIMQMGADVYSGNYSDDVIVFPIKDPYIPSAAEMEARMQEAFAEQSNVEAGANEGAYPPPVGPVLTGVLPQYALKVPEKAEKARRLTGY